MVKNDPKSESKMDPEMELKSNGFWEVKTTKTIKRSSISWFLDMQENDGKSSQNGSQNAPKSMLKSDPKRGRKRSRNSRGKSAPTGGTWSENGAQMGSKSATKTIKNEVPKSIPKTSHFSSQGPWPRNPKGNLISTRFLRKNNKKEDNLQKTCLKIN